MDEKRFFRREHLSDNLHDISFIKTNVCGCYEYTLLKKTLSV